MLIYTLLILSKWNVTESCSVSKISYMWYTEITNQSILELSQLPSNRSTVITEWLQTNSTYENIVFVWVQNYFKFLRKYRLLERDIILLIMVAIQRNTSNWEKLLFSELIRSTIFLKQYNILNLIFNCWFKMPSKLNAQYFQ